MQNIHNSNYTLAADVIAIKLSNSSSEQIGVHFGGTLAISLQQYMYISNKRFKIITKTAWGN